jgi:hypothetical protein
MMKVESSGFVKMMANNLLQAQHGTPIHLPLLLLDFILCDGKDRNSISMRGAVSRRVHQN